MFVYLTSLHYQKPFMFVQIGTLTPIATAYQYQIEVPPDSDRYDHFVPLDDVIRDLEEGGPATNLRSPPYRSRG